MAASDDDKEGDFDPRRRLCQDGSCVGVIGSDGKCTVCGAADPGGESPEAAPAWDREDDDQPLADGEAMADALTAEGAADGFDPNRRLCEDDSCIGVVGSDNRCSVCGKTTVI